MNIVLLRFRVLIKNDMAPYTERNAPYTVYSRLRLRILNTTVKWELILLLLQEVPGSIQARRRRRRTTECYA
jgi:hypothetical protein